MGKVLFFVVLCLAVVYVFGDFLEENDAKSDEKVEGDDVLLSRLKRQIRLDKKKAQKKQTKKITQAIKKKNGNVNACATTDFRGLQDTCCLDKLNDLYTVAELQNCKIIKTESSYKFAFSAGYIKFQDSTGKVGYVAKSGWEKTIPAAATGMRCLFGLMNAVSSNGDVDYDKLKSGYEARASGPWNYTIGQIVDKARSFENKLKTKLIAKSASSTETVNVVSLFVQQVVFGMIPNVCGDAGKISDSNSKYSECTTKLNILNKCDAKLVVQVPHRPPPATEAPAAAPAAGSATNDFAGYQ